MKIKQYFKNHPKQSFLLGGLASFGTVAAGMYWYASRVEARRFQLESVNVITGSNGDDSKHRNGKDPISLRVLHLSDLHLTKGETHKIDFIKRATDDDYDLVVLTGDIFQDYEGLPYASALISRPPRLGAYAVLGNHDYYEYTMLNRTLGRLYRKYRHPDEYRDISPLIESLNNADITVMRNSVQTHADDRVHIVGVDYPGIGDHELNSLVASAPDHYLKLLLFHVPVGLDRFASAGAHIAFGGHTHGGQVRIPGYGAVITESELPRHEASGLLWRGNMAVHVSRGLGADPRTNFRFFCPPHATIVNIKHMA